MPALARCLCSLMPIHVHVSGPTIIIMYMYILVHTRMCKISQKKHSNICTTLPTRTTLYMYIHVHVHVHVFVTKTDLIRNDMYAQCMCHLSISPPLSCLVLAQTLVSFQTTHMLLRMGWLGTRLHKHLARAGTPTV